MEIVESYTQKGLAEKEHKDPLTIKRNYKYIPIAFHNGLATSKFKRGLQKNDYTTKYISLEDINKFLKENYKKELFIIDCK